MSRSRPFKPSQRACDVIGAEHEALLRSIGGNPCDYCSKRGSVGCAWEITAAAVVTSRAPPDARPPTPARAPARATAPAPAPAAARPPGPSGRHIATEVASHLGP